MGKKIYIKNKNEIKRSKIKENKLKSKRIISPSQRNLNFTDAAINIIENNHMLLEQLIRNRNGFYSLELFFPSINTNITDKILNILGKKIA